MIRRWDVWKGSPGCTFKDRYPFSGLKGVLTMCHDISYEHEHNQEQIGYIDDIEVSKRIRHAQLIPTCESILTKTDDSKSLCEYSGMVMLHRAKVNNRAQVCVHGDLSLMHNSTQFDLAWAITLTKHEGTNLDLTFLRDLDDGCATVGMEDLYFGQSSGENQIVCRISCKVLT